MKVEFFDANLFIGRPAKDVFKPAPSAGKLTEALKEAGIKKALVWHIAQCDASPVEGNRLLSREIAGQKNLFGTWTILPPQTEEVIGPNFFREMKRNRIFGLRAFPVLHNFLLNRAVFGKFLEELTERRIPLLLSLEKNCVSWQVVYQLLAEFPRLTCILCDLGIWGTDRYTWPLLENYPNLLLETSLISLEDGGIEATVNRFGAGRLVFGTDFPERYPEASMLQLLHAEISDSDRRKIASANLEKVLSGAKI